MNTLIQIISAGPDDFDIIHSLAEIIWPHTYSKILSREQLVYMFDMMYSRESYTKQIIEKGHRFILAKSGNEYIGFASYEPDYKPASLKLHKLYVLPDRQRSGAGRELLKAIETYAGKHNIYKITLNVNRYNPAVNFYEAKGFLRAGTEDINIGNGYLMEDYVMEKKI